LTTLRPISLEFVGQISDHLDVLDNEEPKSDPQELDLGESLDALLSDIDESCASFEDQPVVEADKPMLISDDGTAVGESVEETAEPDAQVDAEPETDSETVIGEDTVGQDTLEAIDAVEQNAESLLEDTIGELLGDDITEGEEPVDAEKGITDGPDEVVEELSGEVAEVFASDGEDLDVDLLELIADDVTDGDPISAEMDESPVATGSPEIVQNGQEQTGDGGDAELMDSINEDLISEIQTDHDLDELDNEVASVSSNENLDASIEPFEDASESETTVAVKAEADGSQIAESVIVDAVVDSESEIQPEAKAETNVTDETLGTLEIPSVSPDETDGVQANEVGEDESLSLGNLDDALAGIGDDLMMGDFETADGEFVDSSNLEESIDPAMLLDQLDITDALPTVEAPPDEEPANKAVEEVGSNDPGVSKAVASVESSDEEDVASARVPEAVRASLAVEDVEYASSSLDNEEIESIWQTLVRVGKVKGRLLLTTVSEHGGPMAAKGVLTLSKPLASKPAHVRDSIGYVAIWTVFLAMILWMYTMFFRTTPTPTPTQAPTRVVSPSDDLEPIDHQLADQP
jgi:hypothetical protein